MKKNSKFLNLRGHLLSLETPVVMGILNLSPDSFFRGSRVSATEEVLEKAAAMFNEGAMIIDIGAASTRPGANLITPEEELARVRDLLPELVLSFPGKFFSIDSYHAGTAEYALMHGFHMMNDVSAGRFSPELPALAARYKVPYVLMHMQGEPATMQKQPHYEDVFTEVLHFLVRKSSELRQSGIHDIILDPGFGFGKTPEHNFELMRRLMDFKISDMPLMVGVSRKSMITKTLNIGADEALNGSTVLHTWALLNGADILRVHDVKAAVETLKLYQELTRHVA
jgi:dihydropteroate synthase